ncbi:glycosyltransferase [Saccharothrix texasensis]|uniref:Galactosyltransferase-like protein n=1 Tax=Saccharothrix texasensis TaxID=103734 RepID=A0A3N1GYB6_9PSEU|nr:glycosyltransferase [Saccharothrix texasensis]ROP35323.1 galactosyltransferase-like protein [Saccharothrix texasensis]
MPPRISVVIPTYNRAELLRRTLDSLTDQTLPPDDYEVIVSDDGSNDHTADVTETFRDRLRLHYHYEPDLGRRVAHARNAGARHATAPVLVFLDCGTLAGPDFTRAHADAHTGRPTLNLGYVHGYRPWDPTPGLAEAITTRTPKQVHQDFKDHPGFRDIRHEPLAAVDFDPDRLAFPWLFAWGMNYSLRTTDFHAVGGFDERFVTWGTEDIELGYRAHKHGLATHFDLTAWAVEPPHERDTGEMLASAKRTMRQFLDKTREPGVELVWASLELDDPLIAEGEHRTLTAWTDQARALDVRAEIDRHTADAGGPVCVIGCGDDIPDTLPEGSVLIDFDAELLAKAGGGHARHHAIGLQIPLPDDSVQRVVVTSRLDGMWSTWGDVITAEARRVGREVPRTPAQRST